MVEEKIAKKAPAKKVAAKRGKTVEEITGEV